MAITYDKIAYDEVELGLRSILSTEYQNVYIGNTFKMIGNECIKINLISSTSVEQATNFETREYALNLRYYFKVDTSQELEIDNNKVKQIIRPILDVYITSAYKSGAEVTEQNLREVIQDMLKYTLDDFEKEGFYWRGR